MNARNQIDMLQSLQTTSAQKRRKEEFLQVERDMREEEDRKMREEEEREIREKEQRDKLRTEERKRHDTEEREKRIQEELERLKRKKHDKLWKEERDKLFLEKQRKKRMERKNAEEAQTAPAQKKPQSSRDALLAKYGTMLQTAIQKRTPENASDDMRKVLEAFHTCYATLFVPGTTENAIATESTIASIQTFLDQLQNRFDRLQTTRTPARAQTEAEFLRDHRIGSGGTYTRRVTEQTQKHNIGVQDAVKVSVRNSNLRQAAHERWGRAIQKLSTKTT